MNFENWYFLDLRLVRSLVKKLGWNLLMEIQRISSVIRGTKGLMFELRLLGMPAYLLGILARVLSSFLYYVHCFFFSLAPQISNIVTVQGRSSSCRLPPPPKFEYCNWARKREINGNLVYTSNKSPSASPTYVRYWEG